MAWIARLARAAETGAPLDLSGITGRRQWDDDARTWPRNATIKASALRAALLASGPHADPHGLTIVGARFTGATDLADLDLPVAVALQDCRFDEPIEASRSRWRAFSLGRSHMPGAAFSGAVVSHWLDLSEIVASGAVILVRVRVGGYLSLAGANLSGGDRAALALDGAQVEGNAILSGLHATGQVRALGAHIAGQLNLKGAQLVNPGAHSLSLDGIKIDSGAFLTELHATGEVRASGAHIAGQLNLRKAQLDNPDGTALGLDGIRIDSGAYFAGLRATGVVRAVGSHIGAQLDLRDAHIDNPGGDALSLDRTRIDGNAVLTGLHAAGGVRALGAHIAGQLALRNAQLDNPDGDALCLQAADVAALILKVRSSNGVLNLTGAAIGNLVVPVRGSTPLPIPLQADGWRVHDLHGQLQSDPTATIAWLETATKYAPQPWHALADIYERNGQPEAARRLRFEAAKRTTRNAPRRSRLSRRLYGATVGYGYHPFRAAGWLVAVALAAFLLARIGATQFVPTDLDSASAGDSREVVEIVGTTPHDTLSADYRVFSPAELALDVALPAARVGQLEAWRPASGSWIAYPLVMLRALAWLMTVLLLAGLTGVLRKT